MSVNLFSPPVEIKKELKNFCAFLDKTIPAKKLDKNVLICTWNIRMFGDITMKWQSGDTDSPKRDAHALLCIVEIIKRFDIIAVQEIRGNFKGLRETMHLLGSDWSFLMTDVTAGSKGNNERLAFIFDTRKVRLSGLACEIVIPDEVLENNKAIGEGALQRQFARTPYGVSFKAGKSTFVLLTLHVLFGSKSKDRVGEIQAIADWIYDWSKEMASWNHSLLTLGDFNLMRKGDPTFDAFISTGLFIPDDLQQQDRTVFKKTNTFYDQVAWFENNLNLTYVQGGTVDFRDHVLKDRNYTISQLSFRLSDHFPLWTEFLTQ